MSQAPSPLPPEPVHLQDADGFYEALLDAHQGLTTEQSALLNARLILVLANRVANPQALTECLQLARTTPDLPEPQRAHTTG